MKNIKHNGKIIGEEFGLTRINQNQ